MLDRFLQMVICSFKKNVTDLKHESSSDLRILEHSNFQGKNMID
jgi:hypothetical protein